MYSDFFNSSVDIGVLEEFSLSHSELCLNGPWLSQVLKVCLTVVFDCSNGRWGFNVFDYHKYNESVFNGIYAS